MEDNFDFGKVGKRMPYDVPNDFFDRLEEKVLEVVEADHVSIERHHVATPIDGAKHSKLTRILGAAAAVAAVVIIVTSAVHYGFNAINSMVTIDNVVTAYSNLNDADQDYLLTIYDEELYLEILNQ